MKANNQLLLIFIMTSFMFSIVLSTEQQQNSNLTSVKKQKIIEITPSALQIIINTFDQTIILFIRNQTQSELNQIIKKYESMFQFINETHPSDNTFIGYVNISTDFMGVLPKTTQKLEGIVIFTRYEDIALPNSSSLLQLPLEELKSFYTANIHPKIQISSKEELTYIIDEDILVFSYTNETSLASFNLLYKNMGYFLRHRHNKAFAIQAETNQIYLSLANRNQIYYKGELSDAEQIQKFIHLQTLPLLSNLDLSTLSSIFGIQGSSQLILLYEEKNKNNAQILRLRYLIQQSALKNKEEDLFLNRVICAEVTVENAKHFFEDEIVHLLNQNNSLYRLFMIRADFDTFAMRRYDYPYDEVTVEKILTFLEEVRLKKIKAVYKSEPIPAEADHNQYYRKIVGKTLLDQVYSDKDHTVIILFVDSKYPNSYLKKNLEKFLDLYRSELEELKIKFGIFDLHKNEHELLHIQQTPQLIMFEQSNKKEMKLFRKKQYATVDEIRRWINDELKAGEIIFKEQKEEKVEIQVKNQL